jgi:nitrogenase molybdenum-iron protein NifN
VALGQFLAGVGGEIVAAVASTRAEVLADLPAASGAHRRSRGPGTCGTGAARPAHRRQLARRAQRATPAVPLLRAGFPQYDWVGGYARTWVGYRGARQALFDIANLFLGNHHDTPVHRSIYRVGSDVDTLTRAPSGAGLVRH